MVKLSITMNTGRLLDNLKGMTNAISDFNTVFEKTGADFREHMKEVFATEGGSDGAPWAQLKEKYEAEKAASHPGKTILRRNDVMYRSLTRKGAPFSVMVKSRAKKTLGSMTIGTRVPYASFHQTGTIKMRRRQLFRIKTTARFALVHFREHVNEIIQDYGFRRPGSRIERIIGAGDGGEEE